jgi:hypothetical protein
MATPIIIDITEDESPPRPLPLPRSHSLPIDLTVDESPRTHPLPSRPHPLPSRPLPLPSRPLSTVNYLSGWHCDHCTFFNVLSSLGDDCETCGLPSSTKSSITEFSSTGKRQSDDKSSSSIDHINFSAQNQFPSTTSSLTLILAKDSIEFSKQKREIPTIVTRRAIIDIRCDLEEKHQKNNECGTTTSTTSKSSSSSLSSSFGLSHTCDHISQHSEKFLWSCGYRNIQMLASSLMTDPTYKAVLFGGCGFIPDIPSIQMWIERAWRLGFDPEGAATLGGKLVGEGKKWIGSTEAATLLRSFGIPAQLVSFHSFDDQQVSHLCSPEENEAVTVIRNSAEARLYDRTGKRPPGTCYACGKSGHFSNRCPNPQEPRSDHPPPLSSGSNRSIALHQEEQTYLYARNEGLAHWVTHHFQSESMRISKRLYQSSSSSSSSTGAGEAIGAIITHPFPVFFQHSGHSRLLVGWETDLVTGLKRSRDEEPEEDDDNYDNEEEEENGSYDIRKFFPSLSKSSSIKSAINDRKEEKKYEDTVLKSIENVSTSFAVENKMMMMMKSEAINDENLRDGKSRLSLLIFDPATDKKEFENSLSSNWRRVIKRGLHTLRESQFEAVWVATGAPVVQEGSEAWEKLKTLDQTHFISGLQGEK